jgi:hypothetical protein
MSVPSDHTDIATVQPKNLSTVENQGKIKKVDGGPEKKRTTKKKKDEKDVKPLVAFPHV